MENYLITIYLNLENHIWSTNLDLFWKKSNIYFRNRINIEIKVPQILETALKVLE